MQSLIRSKSAGVTGGRGTAGAGPGRDLLYNMAKCSECFQKCLLWWYTGNSDSVASFVKRWHLGSYQDSVSGQIYESGIVSFN